MRNLFYAVLRAFGNGISSDLDGKNFEETIAQGGAVPSVGGGSGLTVNFHVISTDDSWTCECDTTFQQILDAFQNGGVCLANVYRHHWDGETISDVAWLSPKNSALYDAGINSVFGEGSGTSEPCFELEGPAWGCVMWIAPAGPGFYFFD